MNTEGLLEQFRELYGGDGDIRLYFAPGRVNLIGEHTDYNGGHVFPCALSVGTYLAARRRSDRELHFYSENFKETGEIVSSLSDLTPKHNGEWTEYVKGVIWAFGERGMKAETGLDIAICGDIPNGSGLSSSASLEVVTGFALRDLYGWEVTNQELALIGQYSENNYNGLSCGIMDQFASAMGKAGCAIFLDTADLSFEYAPLVLDGKKIIVTNSLVKHSLVSSAYNDRRRECAEALADLQKVCGIEALGELTEEEFERCKSSIADEVNRARAKHAVYENRRTIRAVEALKQNDLAEFGRLMNASHVSLRDDYETSCEECDLLAEEAWKVPGVIGSRITGGGFGGCTVSIVEDGTVEEFRKRLTDAYRKAYEKTPEFYVVEVGDGPRRI